MKQKYVITIADIEMNVVTEAESSDVEAIVNMMDRRMRDILQNAHGSCSKTEAALLCGLGFCSERADMLQANNKLEKDLAEANSALLDLKAKLSEQKAEIDRLKNDNDVMHTILERAAATNNYNAQTPKEDPQIVDPSNDVAKKKSGSRIGNMFDLLTFGDA